MQRLKWRRYRSALALVFASASMSWAATKNPVTPPTAVAEARQLEAWFDVHEKLVKQAHERSVDVVFLGDSITEGWKGQPSWTRHFEPLRSANLGVPGDQTQQILWRVQNGELDHMRPKVVVVLAGTNNLEHDSASDIATGIRAITQEVRQRLPQSKVLLLGIFPRGESPADPLRAKIRDVNRLLAPLDDHSYIRFEDIGDRLVDHDGQIRASVMPDFLHLSSEGYERWARAILPAVQRLMQS